MNIYWLKVSQLCKFTPLRNGDTTAHQWLFYKYEVFVGCKKQEPGFKSLEMNITQNNNYEK